MPKKLYCYTCDECNIVIWYDNDKPTFRTKDTFFGDNGEEFCSEKCKRLYEDRSH